MNIDSLCQRQSQLERSAMRSRWPREYHVEQDYSSESDTGFNWDVPATDGVIPKLMMASKWHTAPVAHIWTGG